MHGCKKQGSELLLSGMCVCVKTLVVLASLGTCLCVYLGPLDVYFCV